jgi:hypothetical protein
MDALWTRPVSFDLADQLCAVSPIGIEGGNVRFTQIRPGDLKKVQGRRVEVQNHSVRGADNHGIGRTFEQDAIAVLLFPGIARDIRGISMIWFAYGWFHVEMVSNKKEPALASG